MLNVICKKSPVGYASNTYIISSEGEYAVIDPSLPYEKTLISGRGKYIFLTHSHFDHMLEIDKWVEKTGAVVYISEQERNAPSDPTYNCYKLFFGSDKGYFGPVSTMKHGDVFTLGGETLRVISCPGHTEGSVTLYSAPFAFVGDTVFEGGGYGRCDLPGGDYLKLRKSIERLLTLPDDTELLPGHGAPTTVADYKEFYI